MSLCKMSTTFLLLFCVTTQLSAQQFQYSDLGVQPMQGYQPQPGFQRQGPPVNQADGYQSGYPNSGAQFEYADEGFQSAPGMDGGQGVVSGGGDLNVYDPQGFSGGLAEGAYGPLGDERLYPWDLQDPWMHGYIQYMPFYGAYKHFRPYNYKDVSAQTQTASGWGMSPKMPYSQQYWHRYHDRAVMNNGASSAQESLLDYPQPRRFKRRVEKNNAPQDPNPLNVYPEYNPYRYRSQQYAPGYPNQGHPQQTAPSPHNMPPGTATPPMPNPQQQQMAPSPQGQPYSGVSYQNNFIPNKQQPVLLAP